MSDNKDWVVGLIFGLVIGVGVTVVAYEIDHLPDVRRAWEIGRDTLKLVKT